MNPRAIFKIHDPLGPVNRDIEKPWEENITETKIKNLNGYLIDFPGFKINVTDLSGGLKLTELARMPNAGESIDMDLPVEQIRAAMTFEPYPIERPRLAKEEKQKKKQIKKKKSTVTMSKDAMCYSITVKKRKV